MSTSFPGTRLGRCQLRNCLVAKLSRCVSIPIVIQLMYMQFRNINEGYAIFRSLLIRSYHHACKLTVV